jgi:zinc protease
MARRFTLLVFAVVLGAWPAWAAPLDARREVLPNGLVLLVSERPAVPIVVARAYVRAGSAFDPPASPGLANLAAELLTRGTASRAAPQIDEAIEFVGGSLEASAGRDGATVSFSVLKKDLSLGFDLLAEALMAPAFPLEEFERKVKTVQAAIRRSEEDPEAVAGRALSELLYPGHPYGHQVAGTVESVGAMTRDDVVRFHRSHYRPDSVILVVAGDVKLDEVRTEVARRFGSWARPASPVALPPRASADPSVSARNVTRELTQATLYLGRPAVGQDHPDYYPLVVASYILGGGSASRLYTAVREKAGLAYSVFSHLSSGRYGSSLFIGLQTKNDKLSEALRLAQEEAARMGREPVSSEELSMAKAYLIGSFPLRTDTTSKIVGLLVSVEEMGLGLDYPDRFKERIGNVTAADVQSVAARYLDPSTFSRVIVGKVAAP